MHSIVLIVSKNCNKMHKKLFFAIDVFFQTLASKISYVLLNNTPLNNVDILSLGRMLRKSLICDAI